MTQHTALAPLAVGQTWRHKRERWRIVTIRHLATWGDPPIQFVYVDRNTSRRTQAIRETTLRREYELEDVQS